MSVTPPKPGPKKERSLYVDEVVTYLPDNTIRQGRLSVLRNIALEIRSTRFLMYQLFKRSMLSFYKQSLLGWFWLLIVPMITVGTFILLRGSGVVATGKISAPYPIFATLGVAVWQLFSVGLISGANSLVQGGNLIRRINFSKKSLVIASMGRTLVSFSVLAALVVVLLVVYKIRGWGYQPTLAILLVPIALIPLFLLTLGVSFYLALLNAIMRDIGNVLGILLTFLMLLTPVLYERPPVPPGGGWLASALGWVTTYNPLHYLVAVPRDLILRGTIVDLDGFLISCAVGIGFFVVGLVGFHLTETRIAERI